MTTTEASTQVADLIEGLDHLREDALLVADWLADHAADLAAFYVHAPYRGVGAMIQVKTAEQLATVARLLSAGAPLGAVTKEFTDDLAYVRRSFGSASIQGYASRGTVCERRVVGRETVQEPDPDAPMVTVEREIVEWVCAPLLAEVDA